MDRGPLVSARRHRRRHHRQLVFLSVQRDVVDGDRRFISGVGTISISPRRPEPLVSHAAAAQFIPVSLTVGLISGIVGRKQAGVGAVLSQLGLDKGAHDCDRRIPFHFHTTDEDRHLRLTRGAQRQINRRRLIRGTGRGAGDMPRITMARQLQGGLVSPIRHSADADKRPVAVVAESKIIFRILDDPSNLSIAH